MFTAEKLDAIQAELNAAAETCYADEGERTIVTTVLIPQLRALVSKLLEDVKLPLSPKQADELCGRVDVMIKENKSLLHSEGLLKLLMREIEQIRRRTKSDINENFKQHCREILKQYGIIDRVTLFAKGVEWFKKTEFAPYGYGTGLAIKILGRNVPYVTLKILDEISVCLGFSDASEDARSAGYCSLLESKGIMSRAELLSKGGEWFKNTEFAPHGKGTAFASQILRRTIKKVTQVILEEIADRLGFPKITEEEQFEKYRSILASKKITSRADLHSRGTKWFADTEFFPYGKGRAFASRILGQTTSRITHEILEETADRLGFPGLSEEERLAEYISILKVNGITNRAELLAKGTTWFLYADFPPYGKASAFASEVLGEHAQRNINTTVLHQIADKLGW